MNHLFIDMRVSKVTVTVDAQIAAFLEWSSEAPMKGYGSLGYMISKAMKMPDTNLSRGADRLIQRLRREGVIQLDKRQWSLTEKGQELRQHFVRQAAFKNRYA